MEEKIGLCGADGCHERQEMGGDSEDKDGDEVMCAR